MRKDDWLVPGLAWLLAAVPPSVAVLFFSTLLPQTVLLKWPSSAAVPPILGKRGLLEGDFYANSAIDSPHEATNFITSNVLPQSHIGTLIVFSILGWMLWIALIVLTSVLLYTISRLFFQGGALMFGSASIVPAVFGTSTFLVAGSLLQSGSRFYPPELGWALFGAPVAGWYPLSLQGLNSSGVSILLATASICLWLFFAKKVGKNLDFYPKGKGTRLLVLALVFSLLAGYAHPTASGYLYALVLSVTISIPLLRNPRILFLTLGLAISFISGALISRVIYPGIQNVDARLFEIYVDVRHPHHYLPEYYLEGMLPWVGLNIALGFSLIAAARFATHSKLDGVAISRFWISAFLFLASANLLQMLGASTEDWYLLAVIGPSRLSSMFGLSLIIIWVTFILGLSSSALNKISEKRLPRGMRAGVIMSSTFVICISLASIYPASYAFYKDQSHSLGLIGREAGVQIRGSTVLILGDGAENSLNWREIGLASVYWDDYFPFSDLAITEWGTRSVKVKQLENCLVKDGLECMNPDRKWLQDLDLVLFTGELASVCMGGSSQNSDLCFWKPAAG